MASSKLSLETQRRVDILFPPEEKEEVSRLLVMHFKEGDGLLIPPEELAQLPCELIEDALERVRFAALKYSKGKMERLHEAIRMKDSDWRDLLLAAGFAWSSDAHKRWIPSLRGKRHWWWPFG